MAIQLNKNQVGQVARLAFFIPTMAGGGAERVMLTLAGGIAARGYPTDLVLAKASGPYLDQIPRNVRLVDLGVGRTLASLPALARYLQKEQPVAMLSALNEANIVALWAKRLVNCGTRIVVSEHNTLSVRTRNIPNWRASQMPKLARWFYPWADGIVAVSHGVAEDLAQITKIPPERIQVIYNAIVTPELRAKAIAPLDHPWFNCDQPPVVLAVGRLDEQKDFHTLILAFAQVRRICSARLLILGEGEQRTALESLIKELGLEGDVALPGFVANPYPYMVRAALFVLSSQWEGLPTVLIEALACGMPVIATDCPSGPREILVDGQYGQLIPLGDDGCMAQAIITKLLARRIAPPQESWHLFELETVLDQYLAALLGNVSCVT